MARRVAKATVSVVAIGGVAAGVAYATGSIPGGNGVIQGCYDNGGNVKVVSALPCPKGYTSLQWNQSGANGVSGYKLVESGQLNDDVAGTMQTAFFEVHCPAGKVAIGGGGGAYYFLAGQTVGSPDTPATMLASEPEQNASTGAVDTWAFGVGTRNGDNFHAGDRVSAFLYANCVDAP